NGTSPMNSSPAMIMRATQKKMISGPVTSVSPGKNFLSEAVSSGQPRVEKGQSQDENHVSRTSGSWRRSEPPQAGQAVGSSLETTMFPHASSLQYHAGIR